MDKDEARARLIALAENTPKGEQRDALIAGATALMDDVMDTWLEKHDRNMEIKAINDFTEMLINPSNYERYDFDDCISDSNKANDFFKYVFAMAEQLKEQKK